MSKHLYTIIAVALIVLWLITYMIGGWYGVSVLFYAYLCGLAGVFFIGWVTDRDTE